MEQTQAASSAAPESTVFNPDNLTDAEFVHWRRTGEKPAPAEPAEPAPADQPEETESDDATADAAAKDAQEQDEQPRSKRRPDVEERFKQFSAKHAQELGQRDAEISRLKAEIEGYRMPKQTQADPSPAPAQPQHTRPKPTPQDTNPDGTPKYEGSWDAQFIEDMSDWKADQRIADYQRQQAELAQQRELQAKVAEGEKLYGKDFGKIANDTAGMFIDAGIPDIVIRRLKKSDVFPNLMHALGKDPEARDNFIQTAKVDPLAANDLIAFAERDVREYLSKGADDIPRNEKGQFVSQNEEKAPEKRQTQAPRPPTPVSGGSSRGFDVSDEKLSADEWRLQRDKQLARR